MEVNELPATYGQWHLKLVCPHCRGEIDAMAMRSYHGRCPHCHKAGAKCPGFPDVAKASWRYKTVVRYTRPSLKWWKRLLGLWDREAKTFVQEAHREPKP